MLKEDTGFNQFEKLEIESLDLEREAP